MPRWRAIFTTYKTRITTQLSRDMGIINLPLQDYTDTLEIDADCFGIDSSVTDSAGKNKKTVKKKLVKQVVDFLYDEKKGWLYFYENGIVKEFGDCGIIAILKGAPDLTSGNLEFI